MTNHELSKYIKHYLENDKTHSAIMLTGEWGSGKSYYVQHELIPFLNSDGPDRCITVSLYGLSTLSEISKNIYLEMRIKNKPVKNVPTDVIVHHPSICYILTYKYGSCQD